MKRYIVFYILLLSVVTSNAQQADTGYFYTGFTSTGIFNRTNTTYSYLINNNLKLGLNRKHFETNLAGSWIYGVQQTGLTNNDFSFITDLNLLKRSKGIYYWGLGAYDKSYSLKINHRMQLGLGVGYKILGGKHIVITLSDGPLYEKSQLYDTALYETVRNSFRMKYSITIKNIIIFDGINFLQQSLFSSKDYVIKTNNNLSLRLTSWLKLTIALTYNRINLNNRENLLCNFGFGIEKYF